MSEKESVVLAKENEKRKENNNARQDREKNDREREISVAEEECWLDAMMCYKNMIRSRNSPPALATVVMEMEVLGCWHGSQCILLMLFFRHEAFGTGAGVLSRTVRSLAQRLSG